ncbi:MAG TPA: TonB-dependent receptor, partial [Terriglobia bacterium]|nr:TonB-dependent receptor [Terriglobia bacterium]
MDSTGLIAKYLAAMPVANRYDGGDGLNTAIDQWTRGTNSSGSLGIGAGTDAETDRKQINTKIDHNFNSKNKAAFNLSYQWADGGNTLSSWQTGYGGITQLRPVEFTANVTSTLSASLLNEGRFGLRRGKLVISPAWEQTGDKKAHDAAQELLPKLNGFPVAFVPSSVGVNTGFVAMSPANYICLSPALSGCAEQGNTSPLFDYADTLSWTKDKHTFKFGVDVRHSYSKGWASPTAPIPSSSGGGGQNASTAFQTAANFPNLVPNNQAVANQLLYFLNGSVNTAQQVFYLKDSTTPLTWQDYNSNPRKILSVVQNEFAAFVKDDWKVLPSLTLNLGLRYEYYGVPFEGAGLGTAPLGGSAALFGVSGRSFTNWLRPDNGIDLNLATTSEFVGPKTANPNKALYKNDWNNIGPAVGFAWSVPWFGEGKTNVRGGYQITYSGGGQAQPIDNFIFSNPGFQYISIANVPTDGSYFNLTNLGSVIPVTPTVAPMQPIPVQKLNQALAVYNSNIATPYVQNFTLSVTHDLSRNFTFDVRYVGTRGMKLWGNFDLNASDVFNNQPLMDAFKAARSGADLKPLSAQTPAEQAGLTLLDQVFLGLNIAGNGVTGCNPATLITLALPCGNVNGTTMRGAAEMRVSSTFRTALANGDFNSLAKTLDTYNGIGTVASTVVSVANGERGTVLKRANLGFNIPGGTTVVGGPVVPAGLFPANWISVNPQFSTASLYSDSGSSSYHSLQVQGTLRALQGITYQGTYLYSKSLGISGSTYTNPADRNADYTTTGSDQRHNFRSNGTFELPVGPNKLLLGNSSGLLARMIERWQSSIIYNVSSGTPVSITAGTMLYGLGVPDVVPLPDGTI